MELDYHVGVLRLVHTVEASHGIIDRLARSSTASDAVGAARVFGACRAFELPSGKTGLRAVLRLACSSHDSVKAEAAKVVAASLDVQACETGSHKALEAAKRACSLIRGCGAVDLQCLEALIAAAAEKAGEKKDLSAWRRRSSCGPLWDVAAASKVDASTAPRRTVPRDVLLRCCRKWSTVSRYQMRRSCGRR